MDIRESRGFYDLCVNVSKNDPKDLISLLSKLHEYEFRTIAINNDIDENVFGTDKKKKKKSEESEASHGIVSEPFDIESLQKEFNGKLKILSRITFHCSDAAKTHMLNHNSNLKKYDLYAFAPKTQSAMQFACTQLNVDIITLRPSSMTFKLTKKLYDQAIERGVHFEIQYSDLINTESRKQAIHYSHLFYTYGKSKNVVISSGASDIWTIRNPYDLINLARLLGLNEVKAKASILHQCKSLLLRAERRRRGKAAFVIVNRTEADMTEESASSPKRFRL
ncbi:ribonuclease P protein subunit p30 [Ceratina calcarata]|uniref:Ribonuclease P protein subunit p30 n=1 Tax=Ceratina calcarata TaxID=156304 RepID=A0AAJ7N8M7_9HYME|nr:ribonuclease P protein subunit p30 [Ceratina calcarata]